ncbi:DUF2855 family protein [uncultured Paraglaciecola sp.]|uniref:DUF2855 family protein n=1 Tax=uncultured Paraglaciecola sp. TaxID=1765024 RepID=UPI0026197999|nr:DUF2855 family protein [uncultured Paraglaciecola sp.]
MSTSANTNTEVWINKKDFRKTQIVEADTMPLQQGEIRVNIDKFALTANNIGYAIGGDAVGYWQYFPTHEQDWGKVGVWGFADVIESNVVDVAVGERLYGFFPMSSQLVLKPSEVKPHLFLDATKHRQGLPAFYNQYHRCQAEPELMQSMEDQRSVLFPLYLTGFVIADFLMDNHYFNAEQMIVGSVSSKTGYSLAAFIRSNGYTGKIVGLTSAHNVKFVEELAICDQVVTYDQADTVNNISSVYIDMSGDRQVVAALHHHLADNMKSSQIVGVTHWENLGKRVALPGAQPVFFFTPDHIQKRSQQLGEKVFMEKGFTAAVQLFARFKHLVNIEHHQGAQAVAQLWLDLLDNKISGQRGVMLSTSDGSDAN